jgi:hypothetical protein
MSEWADIGSGLQARKVEGVVEVKLSDPSGTWRHDSQGRLLILTKNQIVNTAARPPNWTAVGGTYESRFENEMYEIRGTALPDLVRHDGEGKLEALDSQSMKDVLLLSQ